MLPCSFSEWSPDLLLSSAISGLGFLPKPLSSRVFPHTLRMKYLSTFPITGIGNPWDIANKDPAEMDD